MGAGWWRGQDENETDKRRGGQKRKTPRAVSADSEVWTDKENPQTGVSGCGKQVKH